MEPIAGLYHTSPPIVSPVWRLHFLNARESSPHDIFALLHYIDLHIVIHVQTIIRTWDDQVPIYWIRFEDAPQALVARGFAANVEGRGSMKVLRVLVNTDLFQLAEEEERNLHFPPPQA
ncbi:hypothetical protein EYR40_010464 [Pleurotus pulmonarius]|nr:hypothetical protein EYR36_010149 [Pleurotus pulmonarius]KAF4588909.1 hypothetical protein EYR40_010464 [Pleurotus pulmonarius]